MSFLNLKFKFILRFSILLLIFIIIYSITNSFNNKTKEITKYHLKYEKLEEILKTKSEEILQKDTSKTNTVPNDLMIHLKAQKAQDKFMFENYFYNLGRKGIFVEFGLF